MINHDLDVMLSCGPLSPSAKYRIPIIPIHHETSLTDQPPAAVTVDVRKMV